MFPFKHFIFLAACHTHPGEKFEDFHLCQPGNYPRFMGKSLYMMKLFVLSLVFPGMIPRQREALERLVQFIVILYVRYFLTGSMPAPAPRLNIQLWYDMHVYRNVNLELAERAIAGMKQLLWYLVLELITHITSTV